VNILFIDTETTGLDPVRNRLLEISARLDVDAFVPSKDGKGVLPERFNIKMLMPYYDNSTVTLGALKVNKRKLIEDRVINEQAFSSDMGAVEFANWMLTMQQKYGDFVVCGHNITFDISFISEALKRMSIEGLKDLTGYRMLDTSSVATFLRLAGLLNVEKSSLSDIGKAMGLPVEGLHDATFDVDLTASVLYAMVKRVTDVKLALVAMTMTGKLDK